MMQKFETQFSQTISVARCYQDTTTPVVPGFIPAGAMLPLPRCCAAANFHKRWSYMSNAYNHTFFSQTQCDVRNQPRDGTSGRIRLPISGIVCFVSIDLFSDCFCAEQHLRAGRFACFRRDFRPTCCIGRVAKGRRDRECERHQPTSDGAFQSHPHPQRGVFFQLHARQSRRCQAR